MLLNSLYSITIVMGSNKDVKTALKKAGAVLVGIAPAAKLSGLEELINNRNKEGLFAGMKWLVESSKKRADPALHIKNAKSVICSAWPYSSVSERSAITRFALQNDYHKKISENLENAWREFKNIGKAEFFVDSKPVAEKAFSELAGIGWIGKNNLLINEKIGSFFCLGLIVTDIELDPDKKAENRCAGCKKCIEACPTGALIEPYRIDCRKCISYLTIEHKGAIPEEIRGLMGNWIYGCDTCQEVCPYNIMAEKHKPERTYLDGISDLKELLLIDENGFNERFSNSNMSRLGRERLIRNAAIAVGNTGDKNAVPFLESSLQYSSPLIREHIEWAINKINELHSFKTCNSKESKDEICR